MSERMTKEQIKVFNDLLQNDNFKGKKSLRHLLWLNTVEPKYQIGECFKVTNRSHYVYGQEVIDFNAKIVKVYSSSNVEEWQYQLEMICKCGEKESVSNEYIFENDLKTKVDNNINIIAGDTTKGDSRFY